MCGDIYKNEAETRLQLIRNFRFLRLYLISLFYSGQSDHPLLAIYILDIMSKPLHPHKTTSLLYNILWIISIVLGDLLQISCRKNKIKNIITFFKNA